MNKHELLMGYVGLIGDNIYSKRDLKGVINMIEFRDITLAQRDYENACSSLVWNFDISNPIVAKTLDELESELDILNIAEVYKIDEQKVEIRHQIFSDNLGERE